MKTKTVTVTLTTIQTGSSYALRGALRSVRSGRIIAKTARLYPYGCEGAALVGAETLASERGYTVEVAS